MGRVRAALLHRRQTDLRVQKHRRRVFFPIAKAAPFSSARLVTTTTTTTTTTLARARTRVCAKRAPLFLFFFFLRNRRNAGPTSGRSRNASTSSSTWPSATAHGTTGAIYDLKLVFESGCRLSVRGEGEQWACWRKVTGHVLECVRTIDRNRIGLENVLELQVKKTKRKSLFRRGGRSAETGAAPRASTIPRCRRPWRSTTSASTSDPSTTRAPRRTRTRRPLDRRPRAPATRPRSCRHRHHRERRPCHRPRHRLQSSNRKRNWNQELALFFGSSPTGEYTGHEWRTFLYSIRIFDHFKP